MRKIRTQADIEKAQRRNKIIGGLFVVFLLGLSSLGYSLMSADDNGSSGSRVEEYGYVFYKTNGLWASEIGGEIFYFQYLPSEVSDIEVILNKSFASYIGEPLYFVGSGEGVGEILNNFNGYILRYQEACLSSQVGSRDSVVVECGADLPVKDCESNLIVFLEGDGNEVYSESSCVYLVGDLRSTDAFLYKILGIM